MELDSNWLLFMGIVLAGVIFLLRSTFLKTPEEHRAANQTKNAGSAGKQTGNSTLHTSRRTTQRSSSARNNYHHTTHHHHHYDDNDSKPIGGGNVCSPGGGDGGIGGGDGGGCGD
ncbi:hypothetical protein QTO17_01405 [Vibrio owensii]